MRARISAIAGRPSMARVAAVVAFLLALPTLGAGYFLDDRFHELLLRGGRMPGSARGVWDLYRFADGGPGYREALGDGWFPWWANPHLKLAFFRPLASLWRAADFALWGGVAWPAHLETCLVYAALAFVAALAYRRLVGGAAAGIAALAYAVDDGHNVPLAWTANRYAILAALFGIGAVLAHTRARERVGARAIGPALFALALLSGETALGVVGYLVAYAWFVDRPERSDRFAGMRALWPYALVLGAWAVAYRALGYGASGSGFYVDPVGAPRTFLAKALSRGPELALSGMFGPPAEAWAFVPAELTPSAAVAAAVVVALIVVGLLRVARGADASARRATSALLVGALLALVPACGTAPDDRNFLIAGFGFFGALGVALAEGLKPRDPGARARPARALGLGLLALAHLVAAPLLLPVRALNASAMFRRFIGRGAASLPARPDVDGKTFVFLGVPDALFVPYMMLERILDGSPHARRGTALSVEPAGPWTADFESEDTLVIQSSSGVLRCAFGPLYGDLPLRVGEVIELPLQRVEVVALTADGAPRTIRVTMLVPRQERVWLVWSGAGFVELPPPKAGDSRRMEGIDLMRLLQEP